MKNYAEMYTNALLIFLAFFIFGCYQAFGPWFRPDQYRLKMKKRRERVKEIFPFYASFAGYDFLEKHPKFDLWLIRLGSLIILLWCGILIVLAYQGYVFTSELK